MKTFPKRIYHFDETSFPSLSFGDMMSDDEVLKKINMKKAVKFAMESHKYEIHHTEKSGWFTNVDDLTKETGKRKIRKCSEEKLWLALADWYADNHSKVFLTELYEMWLEQKKTPLNASNIKRIRASWKAYYKEESLSQELLKKPVAEITSLQLRQWANALLKKHYPVDRKKFYRMVEIMSQCFDYASDEDIKIIPVNIWEKASKKINRELIVKSLTPSDESQIFTDTERIQLRQMIESDLVTYKKQSSTAGLQILFILQTGLRIGECCGLKWSDIKDNRLYICRQADNNGVREWTKSCAGYREIPLTTTALQILEQVSEFNKAHGFTADWIFQSNNAGYEYRLGYHAADRKLRKLCSRLGTMMKSPHKCRKTFISQLLDHPDISSRTVQRIAGHSDIMTTYQHYYFERRSKEEQALNIEKALRI